MTKPAVAHGRLLVVCAVLAGVLLAAGITLRSLEGARSDARICEKVDRLDNVIVALLERSQASLPANPYFKDHPEALAAAQRENARALREFRGAAC